MERRKFSREFKLEAVKLVRDRGVTAAQASRALVLRQGHKGGAHGFPLVTERHIPDQSDEQVKLAVLARAA